MPADSYRSDHEAVRQLDKRQAFRRATYLIKWPDFRRARDKIQRLAVRTARDLTMRWLSVGTATDLIKKLADWTATKLTMRLSVKQHDTLLERWL